MSFCSFSSLLPTKQLFCRELLLPKTCVSSIRMSSSEGTSSSKVLDLDGVASAVKKPTVIMVTLLCGRVLSEWALWLLLRIATCTPGIELA